MRYESHQFYCKTWPERVSGNAPKLQIPCVSRSSQFRPPFLLYYANYEEEKRPTEAARSPEFKNPAQAQVQPMEQQCGTGAETMREMVGAVGL